MSDRLYLPTMNASKTPHFAKLWTSSMQGTLQVCVPI